MKKTYIGKRYLPLDNSYNANLSKPNKENDYIAGTRWVDATETIIKTDPFEVKNVTGKSNTFVIVEDGKGNTHLTLFFEFRIIKSDAHKKSLLFGDKDVFSNLPINY